MIDCVMFKLSIAKYLSVYFRNAVKVLLLHIYIVALSLGVGCKHLLHWLSNPYPDIVTLNPM